MSGFDEIVVPDRFEALKKRAGENLVHIVEPIESTLTEFDSIVRRMKTAGRGAFVILRGNSGSGKSTFLHTIGLFRENVETVSVPGGASIRSFLESQSFSSKTRIFVLEEREAVTSFTDTELETWLHEVNGYCRAGHGANSIVVWPCNTDELRDRIEPLARSIGGKALVGPGEGWLSFDGPNKEKYPAIAEKTLSLTNQSASLSDLGLTQEQLAQCAAGNEVIGDFLSDLHGIIESLQGDIGGLISREQCRLWVLVIAGNEPGPDVAGLTRGASSAIDTERLMSATDANIVAELKKYPEKIGIVGTVLDAKVTHMPVLAASAIVRAFATDTLKVRLRAKAFALKPDKQSDAIARVKQSELAALIEQGRTGVQPRGPKVGSESKAAFEKLCDIATTNDHELNYCIGSALKAAQLIRSFEIEKDFGQGLTRRTDLVCRTDTGVLRIEVMWRKKTSRADIANYTLTKVNNYARAIGFIE